MQAKCHHLSILNEQVLTDFTHKTDFFVGKVIHWAIVKEWSKMISQKT